MATTPERGATSEAGDMPASEVRTAEEKSPTSAKDVILPLPSYAENMAQAHPHVKEAAATADADLRAKQAAYVESMSRAHPAVPDPEVTNSIENVADKRRSRYAEIDVDEALADAAKLRANDRAEISANREGLFQETEREQDRVLRLDREGDALDKRNELAERNGDPSDDTRQQVTEQEKNRRVEMMQHLRSDYRVDGSNYLFKDRPNKVAFHASGDKLKTSTNDQRVARAMATMAFAQGWKTIKVNGHHDFRREVWFEASLHGLKVEGYTPKPEEVKELQEARERQMRNSIEHAPDRQQGRDRSQDAQNRPQTAGERIGEDVVAVARDAPQKAARAAGEVVHRTYTGLLVDHGKANYNHDKDGSPSYYVKLATAAGVRTIWGKDLERAMTDSPAKKGDVLRLDHGGDQQVTVEAKKRDEAGKVIGTESIEAKRNAWAVKLSERGEVVQKIANAVVSDKYKTASDEDRKAIMSALTARIAERDAAGTLPKPKMYDAAAASRAPETDRARPPVERNAERSR